MSLMSPAYIPCKLKQSNCVKCRKQKTEKECFAQLSLTEGQCTKASSICRMGFLWFYVFLLEAYTNWKLLGVSVKRAGKGIAFPYGSWHLGRRRWVCPFLLIVRKEDSGRIELVWVFLLPAIEGQSILFLLPDLLVLNPSRAQGW